MIIDKTHRCWIVASLIVLLVTTTLYVLYARSAEQGPSGGTWQGLLFGIAGSACMVFAGLLSARKKVPAWRIGSARTWLRAHIWLGLWSVPCVLFHAGFRVGGLLEQWLLIVFSLVIASGIVGLALQQYLPRLIKSSIPNEAMFEQIPAVCDALHSTADEKVASLCGSLLTANPKLPADEDGRARLVLREFYLTTVRPFLDDRSDKSSLLSSPTHAQAVFHEVEQSLPRRMHGVLHDLHAICDERRQLARQARMHRWLHGWLFVHVPLSSSLLVLGIWHAIASLYY